MNILKAPDSVLKMRSKPVEPEQYQDVVSLANKMFSILGDGVGLSGIQVGVRKRFFILKLGDTELIAINPVVECLGPTVESIEGCLSIPGSWFSLQRSERVILKTDFFDLFLDGIRAFIVQHEVDHLEGILISERGTNVHLN